MGEMDGGLNVGVVMVVGFAEPWGVECRCDRPFPTVRHFVNGAENHNLNKNMEAVDVKTNSDAVVIRLEGESVMSRA